MFNYAVYGKTSINTISRNDVSYVDKDDLKIVRKLVRQLYKVQTIEEKEI